MLIDDEHEGHKFNWDLRLLPDHPKPAPLVTCPECHGFNTGPNQPIHFGVTDELKYCRRCNNTGKIPDPSFVWYPKPPQELVDALRKTYRDYWNKVQNEKFKLV